ncbi:hypothetical protein P8452_68816 [Trifolium repens]|nr:hypothetical protein P8452_68816 [Trifolium repens]
MDNPKPEEGWKNEPTAIDAELTLLDDGSNEVTINDVEVPEVEQKSPEADLPINQDDDEAPEVSEFRMDNKKPEEGWKNDVELSLLVDEGSNEVKTINDDKVLEVEQKSPEADLPINQDPEEVANRKERKLKKNIASSNKVEGKGKVSNWTEERLKLLREGVTKHGSSCKSFQRIIDDRAFAELRRIFSHCWW